jgi:CheY-like chemotaxis protein
MGQVKKIWIKISNEILQDEDFPGLKTGKYVRISIVDQGSGITEKDLIRIFDPYFTTKTKGTGLGLTTTYSIMKRHDGHIQVTSQLDTGTTVDLYLPATEMEVPAETRPEPVIYNGRGRILVMDDDEMVRELLTQILTHLGYQVDEAENGETTLEKYRLAMNNGNPVDMIIMDLTIPGGMGGKETIKELKMIDTDVKAIVSSGYSNDPIMANYQDYGFVGVLNKPYNVETLSAALSKFLNGNSPA